MSRGIVYVRVSSDEQVKGMSLEFQKADCLAYAKTKGIVIDQIFEDRGESAKFANRPALLELLDYCRKHKKSLSALIFWKLDRLSRNQLDYYYLKRVLLELGISLHSATEPSMDDSSIGGKVFETFSALQAEIDNTIRRERVLSAMKTRLLSGIYPWKPPIGYCRAAQTIGGKKTMPDEPDPRTFPIIQSALRDYATGKYSQIDLLKLLDKKGLAVVLGHKLHHPMVSFILYRHLDFYRGVFRNRWGDDLIQAKHIPMITEEEYLRIIAVRDGRSICAGIERRKEHPDFPLRRTLRCYECGEFLTSSYSNGNGGRYGYYHCWVKHCPRYGRGFRSDKLEKEVAALVDLYQPKPEFLTRLKELLAEELGAGKEESGRKTALLNNRLTELKRKRERLFEMREDGSYEREEFLARKGVVDREMDGIKGELALAENQDASFERVLDYAFEFLAQMGKSWWDMDSALKQRFQQLLFPDGISYKKKGGVGTPKVGLIFGLYREFSGQADCGVRRLVASWNLVYEELARIGKMGKAFHAQDDMSLKD